MGRTSYIMMQNAVEEHEKWLKSGGKQGQRAVLSGCTDLFEIIDGRHMEYADLSYCDFKGRYMNSVRLYRTNLTGANLAYSSFEEGNLTDAVLTKADLRNADLCYARLCGTKMRGAKLKDAGLAGADLRGAPLLTKIKVRAEQIRQGIMSPSEAISEIQYWYRHRKDKRKNPRRSGEVTVHF